MRIGDVCLSTGQTARVRANEKREAHATAERSPSQSQVILRTRARSALRYVTYHHTLTVSNTGTSKTAVNHATEVRSTPTAWTPVRCTGTY
jgi:hypothetical protein